MALQRGIVTDNVDPGGLGRVRVERQVVIVRSDWAQVVTPVGSRAIDPPDVGTVVWLMCENDDEDYPVVLGTVPPVEL
ncbi:MAG: phage baseplate assembly protein V [Microbacterium sp.]